MPEVVLILWLPAAIAFMAVTWVVTLSAISSHPVVIEEAGAVAEDR